MRVGLFVRIQNATKNRDGYYAVTRGIIFQHCIEGGGKQGCHPAAGNAANDATSLPAYQALAEY